MTTLTLTPELEAALSRRAQAQGTTPELLALDGMQRLDTTPAFDGEKKFAEGMAQKRKKGGCRAD